MAIYVSGDSRNITNEHALIKQVRSAANTHPKHRETIIQDNHTILVAHWIAYRYPYRGESDTERERARERENTRDGKKEGQKIRVRKNKREQHRERDNQKEKRGIQGKTSPSDRQSLFRKYERGARLGCLPAITDRFSNGCRANLFHQLSK